MIGLKPNAGEVPEELNITREAKEALMESLSEYITETKRTELYQLFRLVTN